MRGNEGSTLRSALLVPPSYFPPLCSLEFRPSACPPSSHHGFQGSRLHPPPHQFLLFTWLAAERKDIERKRVELARFSHLDLCFSHSVSSSVVLALSFTSWLPRCVGLWMLSLSYLAPPSWSLCDANEGTNTSTLSKSPPRAIPRNAETSIPMRQEMREKGEERRTPVSRGFCCHCERILPVAIQIKSWLSMKFETLAYNLSSPTRRFTTHFLFDKTSLLISFYALWAFTFFFKFNLWHERQTIVNFVETSNSFRVTENMRYCFCLYHIKK